jgi:hypothetical protein
MGERDLVYAAIPHLISSNKINLPRTTKEIYTSSKFDQLHGVFLTQRDQWNWGPPKNSQLYHLLDYDTDLIQTLKKTDEFNEEPGTLLKFFLIDIQKSRYEFIKVASLQATGTCNISLLQTPLPVNSILIHTLESKLLN